MSNEYPVIKFNQRDQDNARTPGGGGGKKPGFTLSGEKLIERAQTLLSELNYLKENWDDQLISEAPVILQISYIDKAKAKSHQEKMVGMFNNYRYSTQIGVSYSDDIVVQIDSLDQMNKVIEKFSLFAENDIPISAITEIKKYSPTILGNDVNTYNITFWNFLDEDKNTKVLRLVQEKLSENKISFNLASYGKGTQVVEIIDATTDKLEFIKKLPIKSIEPTEETESPFHVITESYMQSLEIVQFDPLKDYPLIGLLDSGVEINTYTENWVVRGKGGFYCEAELDKSHGTYIASLLIHGDKFNNTEDFSIPGCKIIDVPIVSRWPVDEKILIRNIESAIESNPEVKVWNLSVSLKGEICDNNFSTFAIELDRIQKNYQVIICKSAGNDDSFFNSGSAGKLNIGADSVRAITVGSINRKSDDFNVTKEGYPSSYSRVGRGPSYIIKPEVVHYGGDLFALNTRPSGSEDYESVDGIGISVGTEKIQKPGTSFSTPKVAKTISELRNLTESEDLLMLKAMLVHSARHSELVNLDKEICLQKMGFGKPKASYQIISEPNNHSVTLMLRGKLEKGKEIDIMDFPYPPNLVENGYFRGRMLVTLVYDPYLRGDLGSEYCQSNMELKFGTFNKKEDVEGVRAIFNPIKRSGSKNVLLESVYSKTKIKENTDYNYERTMIKYGDKYYPVKKYACDLEEFTESNKRFIESDRNWYLYLKGEYRDYILKESDREVKTLETEFCVFITIYDPEEKENIYNSTLNRLDINGFVHEELSLNANLEIDV